MEQDEKNATRDRKVFEPDFLALELILNLP